MKRGLYVSCLPDCEFNKYVGCADCMTCDKCGWNPEVRNARLEKIRTERNRKMITYSYSKEENRHILDIGDKTYKFKSVDEAILFLKDRKEKKDERI